MSSGMRFASAVVLAMLAAVPAAAAPASAPIEGAWSPSVDGVRARLVVTPYVDASKHAQLSIAVEIENTSDRGMPITLAAGAPSQMLDLAVEDGQGKTIERSAIGGNELTPPPFVLALPVRSMLRVVIAPNALEYVPSGRVMLRPFSLTAWEVPAKHGAMVMKATLHPVETKDVKGAWGGKIAVPGVRVM